MGIHEGHRERLRSSFTENGLDSFNELNSLELLLFYAIPRRDTNEIAHRLLERFGTLSGVFEADIHELTEIEGIGENAAALIKLVPQIMRKSLVTKSGKIRVIDSSSKAGEYFLPRFLFQQDEILMLLCLDSRKRVIFCAEVSRGVVNTVETNVRRIVEIALKYRASSVIMAHNHPDGAALPSREDDMATKEVFSALKSVGIPLDDHIIVAENSYVSYADTGMMFLFH